MKSRPDIDPLRLLALVLMVLPALTLAGLGMLWLWQAGLLLWWLLGLLALCAIGYAIQWLLERRQRRLLSEAMTEPDPHWPPSAGAVWQEVDALANGLQPGEWPLDDGDRMLALGRRTLETVARRYHPEREHPLLELTLPHALFIIERASRDLREDIAAHVPLSHRLTLGDVVRLRRWQGSAERAFDLYRLGRLVASPLEALISEAWREVRGRGFGIVGAELHGWLLRAYVRKIGYYAIDLYSGQVLLDESGAEAATRDSQEDLERADAAQAEAAEPLRIVVLGRHKAGRSSLVNALAGQPVAPADAVAAGGADRDTSTVPVRLEHEGLAPALLFEAPACDRVAPDAAALRPLLREADLLLWVSPVHRPDRDEERLWLDELRAPHADAPDRPRPPLLVVASHIDLLRPAGEWQPPYDPGDARDDRPKTRNLRAALAALADALDVPPADVVPACLAPDRLYNLDAGVWPAILQRQDAALRIRLLRCREARRREEHWRLLGRQLRNTGRRLWRPQQGRDAPDDDPSR